MLRRASIHPTRHPHDPILPALKATPAKAAKARKLLRDLGFALFAALLLGLPLWAIPLIHLLVL